VIPERLRYWGVPFSSLSPEDLAVALPALTVVITVGDCPVGTLPDLTEWLERGGTWIAVGGLAGMPELLGVEPVPPAFGSWGGGVGMLGEGWMRCTAAHPTVDHISVPLHYFNGTAVRLTRGGTALAVAETPSGAVSRPAIVLSRRGRGRAILLAPDIPGALVRIRQGLPVGRDGIPAPDGTAPVADGVLKSDDGAVLDWERDRQPVPGTDGLRCFLTPIADQWEELLIRCILWGAAEAGCSIPLLWLYPRNLPAIAVLSHDSDGNDPSKACAMLRILSEAAIHTTWCLLTPGYPAEVIAAICQEGHELAMHFDAMTEGTRWQLEEFAKQHRGICEMIGNRPVTNKNHYLRWEGDIEFFEWCAAHGIRLDQSKGASKTGEAGFNFGTCHLYRPVRRDGSHIDIWEMPTPTQDLVVFAPPALGKALQAAVLRASGILHLLFHPAHIETAGVAEALSSAVASAKSAGMEWWTAAEAAEWMTSRMTAMWSAPTHAAGGSVAFAVSSARPLQEATVLWLREDGPVERLGFRFIPQTISLDPGNVTAAYLQGGD